MVHNSNRQAAPELGEIADEEAAFLSELPKQYKLLGKISQGGMGAIYKAQNKYTGALFAIKVIKLESVRREKDLQRFVIEARAASLLKHPRICRVHDFGLTESKMPFLVMDWIDGIALSRKIQQDGRMSVPEATYIFQQISSALEHAHSNKVVHRDLKPDNIMLDRDADGRTQIYIVDFGIAKVMKDEEKGPEEKSQLTSTGTFVGTPLFMSPEQARASSTIDHRSDLYSFGCMMYYVLTGEAPFIGNSAIDTIAKHLHQTPADFPARFKIPPDLRAIVFKCMEKNVEERYQSAVQLSEDLKKLEKGVGIKHRPLVHEREKKRKQLVRIGAFILGFAAMYGISIGMQYLLDTTQSKKEHRTETATKTPVEYKKENSIKHSK
jgi:serine/threonine protein kinase